MPFESRHRERLVRRGRNFNKHLRQDQLANGDEIFLLVRRNADTTPRDEHAMNGLEKGRLYDPAAFVFPLRPWIGKKKMRHLNRPWRKQVLDRVAALDPEEADIAQPEPGRLLAAAQDAASELLDSKEISLRKFGRELNNETAITAAEINLEWSSSSEDLPEIEPSKIIFRNKFELRAGWRFAFFLRSPDAGRILLE